jgi:hypothetical protein
MCSIPLDADKKTDAPAVRYVRFCSRDQKGEKLLLVRQSLGIGLASVLASTAVDAVSLRDDADVLAADVAFLDGARGTFFDALLAEGASFGVDSISHGKVPPNQIFLANDIISHLPENAIQKSQKFFGYFTVFRA